MPEEKIEYYIQFEYKLPVDMADHEWTKMNLSLSSENKEAALLELEKWEEDNRKNTNVRRPKLFEARIRMIA